TAIENDGGNAVLAFGPLATAQDQESQILTLGTPSQAMTFGFNYRLVSGTDATISAYLNSVLIGTVNPNSLSSADSNFSTPVTDPSLFGLSNPEFKFVVTTSTGTAKVYVDNIVLSTAIPEPALLGFALPVGLLLSKRRR